MKIFTLLMVSVTFTASMMNPPAHKNRGDGDIYRAGKQLIKSGIITGKLTRDEQDGAGTSPFIYISIKDIKGSEFLISAGPDWFSKTDKTLKFGDKIEVTGALVIKNNEKTVLAKLIKKDNAVIYLRNYNGDPLWEYSDGDSMKKPSPGGMPGGGMGKGGKPGNGGMPRH